MIATRLFLTLAFVSTAVAQIHVTATTPDLADLARRIGGDAVAVESLTDGSEDIHFVLVRPSMLNKVRKADVLLEIGLDLEHAWLPALLRTSRNDGVQPGAPGFVNCSAGIRPLRIPTDRSRGAGTDLHPNGNPHYNLDPEAMRQVARTIRDAFSRLKPEQQAAFATRCAEFEAELDRKLAEWKAKLEPFRGAAFVEYHDSWVYFAERFGLRIVARLEPKPGLAPTPSHLSEVIAQARTEGVGLVVARPATTSVAEKVASECGAKAVALPLSSTSEGEFEGWFAFMDRVVATFASNLRKAG